MSYRKWETKSIGVLHVEWKHKCNKTDLIAPKTTNSINKVLMILKQKKKKICSLLDLPWREGNGIQTILYILALPTP